MNFMSKTDDVVWLAYQLKNKLGDKISINKFGLWKEVLEAKYNLKGHYNGIDFGILYSDNEFLRISVGEIGTSLSSYEEKLFVLNELKNAVSTITRNGISLGEPSVFYNVRDEEYMIPHLEYIYADKENYIKSFQDKTIFDDGIPEDVIIFDKIDKPCNITINRCYQYNTSSDNKLSLLIEGSFSYDERLDMYDIVCENLDNIFNNINYKEIDLAWVVRLIRGSLSFVQEDELDVSIVNNDNVRVAIYENGKLYSYVSNTFNGDDTSSIRYSLGNGIKFDTSCENGTTELIELIKYEMDTLNDLMTAGKVETNDNLLKLVKRINK